MIQTGLFFILGLLSASFVALLLAPVVWHKAQRLAFREYRAEIPASAREVRAEIDAVRAQAAVEIRRQDVLAARIRDKAARERAEAGRIVSENGELRARMRAVEERSSSLENEAADRRDRLRLANEEIVRLEEALAAARAEAAMEAEERAILAERFEELAAQAEARDAEILALRAAGGGAGGLFSSARSGATAGPARRGPAERGTFSRAEADARLKERVAALGRREPARRDPDAVPDPTAASAPDRTGPAAALAELKADLAGRKLTAAELADAGIRARIDDIAAHIVRLTAEREGAASPVKAILDDPAGRSRSALAERIRDG